MSWRRWGLRCGALAGASAAAAAADDRFNDRVGQRTFRAAAAAVHVAWMYKTADPATVEEASALHRRAARRIAEACRANEGLYVKFGQAISTLNHILPPEYFDELRVLLADAAPVPFSRIRATIEADFGRPVEQVFASFDERPVATASIAQVHRATLAAAGGGPPLEVAVKVLKPEIRRQIQWDLWVAHYALTLGERLFGLPMLWGARIVRRNSEKETDFTVEADWIRRGAAALAATPFAAEVVTPAVVDSRSTTQVLVTEWVGDATPMSDPAAVRARFDVKRLLGSLYRAYADLVFVHGVVHADPHGGNILVRPAANAAGQEVVLLDWGLTIGASDRFRREYAELFEAALTHNLGRVDAIMAGWGAGHPQMLASFVIQKPLSPALHASRARLSPGEVAAYQSEIKGKLASLFADVSMLPDELLPTARGMNHLRSLNKPLGLPVNRIDLIAGRAVEALRDRETWTWKQTSWYYLGRIAMAFGLAPTTADLLQRGA